MEAKDLELAEGSAALGVVTRRLRGELGEIGFWKVAKIRHILATVLVRP